MPFGLTNAPATFQTLINKILSPYLYKNVIVYLDDIVVFSKTLEEHKKHLEQVFLLLGEYKLYASSSKYAIRVQEFDFCGHRVTWDKTEPLEDKVAAVREWPVPKTAYDVRQFLGLASFYRRYIKRFAYLAAPLSNLLKEANLSQRKKKYRPIIWNAQCKLAFDDLKQALTSYPVLYLPDPFKPFVIETDASKWAISGVLYQADDNGKLRLVAFKGRKQQGAKLNYPVHEKELLAIKECLRKWEHYILNRTTTTVVTNYQSLQYINSTKSPSKRLARWIEEFQAYSLNIKYRKGSEAIVPDALLRRSDFIGQGPTNVAQVVNVIYNVRGISEIELIDAIVKYLKTNQLLSNSKLSK